MGRIGKIVLWLLLGLYIPVMLAFVSFKRNDLVCNSIKVSVSDSASLRFISPNEVSRHIHNRFKGLKGSRFDQIRFDEVEKAVLEYSAVEKCKVYPSLEGALCVVVEQRNPILRLFDQGASYLIDEKGVKIPLRGSYTKPLMVVSGNLKYLKDKNDLLVLSGFIEGHSFWRDMIEQIVIKSNGDFLLIPRIGNHQVLFGGIDEMENKFRNLKALYEDGLDPMEWNSYDLINVKYKGQVICSKL